MPLPQRTFGRTSARVSALGLGAAQIGSDAVSDHTAERVLCTALELGITLFDTAPSYGHSETRIGRFLSHRRKEFALCTKGGYGVPNVADWTPEVLLRGVDQALVRMRTDYLDAFFLHSCPRSLLEREELLRALETVVQQGKVRLAGYSGDNEPLLYAVQSKRFGAIETSLNVCDQHALLESVPLAHEQSMAVIAKRSIANAPWRFAKRPIGDYAEAYWERLQAMQLDPSPLSWEAYAIRFAAFLPGVTTCILGTANEAHLRTAVAAVAQGPLSTEVQQSIQHAYRQHGASWTGQV